MSKNTGARGLRTILETILMDSMYEVCYMMILYSLSIHLTCKVYGVGILIVVTTYNWFASLQIPDAKSGEKRIDAVVVDEDAVGSVDQPGCGAKILYGDGALDQYLSQIKVRLTKSCDLGILVCYLMQKDPIIFRSIPFAAKTTVIW